MSVLSVTVGLVTSGFRRGLTEMQNASATFKNQLKDMFTGVVGPAALAVAAVAAVKKGFSDAAEMEKFQTSFVTLLGTVSAAKQRIQELASFAKATPFELPEIVEANKVLETLTKGTLSTAEGMTLVGDAAAMAGVPLAEFAVTVGRVKAGIDAGSATIGAEINRLNELGVISISTKNAVASLMAEGRKGESVWRLVADELKEFEGEMDRLSSTFEGRVSALADAWSQLLVALVDPAMDDTKSGLAALTALLEDLTVKARESSRAIRDNYGVTKDATLGMLTGGFVGAFRRAAKGKEEREAERAESERNRAQKAEKEQEALEAREKAARNKAEAAAARENDKRLQRIQVIHDREQEAALAALEGQEKINALVAERARLMNVAEESRSTDEAIKAAEEAQKLQRQIETEEKKQADAKQRRDKEIADARAEEDRAAEESRFAKMSEEEQLAELRKRQAEAAQRGSALEKTDPEAAAKARTEALRLQDDIDRRTQDREKRTEDAKEREREAMDEYNFDQLDPKGQLMELEKRKRKLLEEAKEAEKGDPARAAELRTEAIGVQRDIDRRKKEMQDEEKRLADEALKKKEKPQFAAVAADSLQRVGGGSFSARSPGDPALRLQERQVNLQEEANRILNRIAGEQSQPKPANPWQ